MKFLLANETDVPTKPIQEGMQNYLSITNTSTTVTPIELKKIIDTVRDSAELIVGAILYVPEEDRDRKLEELMTIIRETEDKIREFFLIIHSEQELDEIEEAQRLGRLSGKKPIILSDAQGFPYHEIFRYSPISRHQSEIVT